MRPSHPVARLLALSVVAGLTIAGLALPVIGGAGLFARAASDSFVDLPSALTAPPPPQRSRLVAADGSTIATFFSQDRVVMPLSLDPPIGRASQSLARG